MAAAMHMTHAAAQTYVAPDPRVGLSSQNEEYLIGVISMAVIVLAVIMGVASMVNIDYDDDTLLMVEVPADTHQKE
ncbi:hypothetical protein JKF63_05780 [Porcisia hertigi]|uniref:Uncharacterized protein n=1 Tax=Porcisia hertigi TaxID=2761500 RepID=A0A836LCJ4_9TRYP|nr:hypothetical protein JKF63_05780 [Porcisia hertigi]